MVRYHEHGTLACDGIDRPAAAGSPTDNGHLQTEAPMTMRRSKESGFLARGWSHVLDVALVLWVVRVPFAFTLLGLLLLGMAPQAQDLFVELALTPSERVGALPYGTVLSFLAMLLFVWAMPTHYA